MWFITMFIVDSNVGFSFFDFYAVFAMITANGSFWLTTILLCTLIIGKDAYLCALERGFNYKNYQIIQEIEHKGEGGAMSTNFAAGSKKMSLGISRVDADEVMGNRV
jgi:hypothetical protein